MGPRVTGEDFLRNLTESGLFSQEEIGAELLAPGEVRAIDGAELAQRLIASGKLTPFQANAVADRHFEQLVIGNYQVIDRLGSGGMGTVYKAQHRRMKRIVAIKVLARSAGQSETFVRRFQREVEAVARLSHPNIVMAYDADEAEVGHFLVMEFVNGRDLASEVQKHGPLPIGEAVECISQAARALSYAHAQGIVHRDIKPANLLRDVNGVVKVADLGLARFNDSTGGPSESASTLTQTGTIMGTVDFMSPEQAQELAGVDHRSDIYSLGCTFYFLVTGRAPYESPSLMTTLLKHRDAPIPSLRAARSEVPAALDQVFKRSVAKKPEDRFAIMAEFLSRLEDLALGSHEESKPKASLAATQVFGIAATLDLDPSRTESGPSASAGLLTASGSTPAVASGTQSVLLVEPSRTQAVIVRKFLQQLGFLDVTTTPSGANAIDIARELAPDVVISAMHLEDMTGMHLAQRMRTEQSLTGVGFVLITSQGDGARLSSVSQATHTIRLPKPFDLDQLAEALAAARGIPSDQTQARALKARAPLKVLLVDDSAPARTHIRSMLAEMGLRQVIEAADGAEAVALLEKQSFDLVVTDYNMPRVDGLQLLEFIRHHSSTPSVPVIIVTTETDPAKLAALRQLSVSAICEKSFKPEVVRGVLKRLE